MKHFYGWRADNPDQRDKIYQAPARIPLSVDLRPQDTPIYDQGQLGSCTANAIAGHLDFNRKKQGESTINPSRLFIYYNERASQNTVDSDSGASIRESAKTVKNQGTVPEVQWPYDISKFTDKPTPTLYAEAVNYEALSYLSIKRSLNEFKGCLSEGFPFVIGISVYESFETSTVAQTGIIPMPKKAEKLLGGHALMVVGYDDSKEWFIVRNSWSESWGDKGYCYIPYKYLINAKLSSDFWTLRNVK